MLKNKKKNPRNYYGLWLLPEAKLRLDEMQVDMKRKGCRPREVALGRLIEILIFSPQANELLEKNLLST